jgi:D-inositol-3-phosphate glycosyltransferase
MPQVIVLSMHTSPLEQPGTGDGGGMNVYVRELSAALARAGASCEVFTRAARHGLPATVDVEPGFRLHHVISGPETPLPKSALYGLTARFGERVGNVIDELESDGGRPLAIHANYWLSGLAGQDLKERFGVPLVSTFHTLDRVKAEASAEDVDIDDPERRARSEAEVIGCSDAVLASCDVEVDQLVELYGAERSRVEVIAPGVDHAFFSPGDRRQARRAIGEERPGPLLLFVGRIQPLKGADVAVRALAELVRRKISGVRLLIVGGPSGPQGGGEVEALHALVKSLDLRDRVRFLPPQRHELLSTFYRAADCCVVPSMSESFGLVALEAAACGTPVVASAVGGLTSIVADGRTGFLLPSRDVAGFAARLDEIVSHPDLAARLGAAAAYAARHYTWSVAAARLLSLYDELSSRALVECA